MRVRLQDLAVQTELKDNPTAVLARISESLAETDAALGAAGEKLRAAKAAKEAGYQKLAELNREFKSISILLRNSKQLALSGDNPTIWSECRKNRERRQQLADLVAYQTLWCGPSEALAVLQSEIDFENAKADLLETQCVQETAKATLVAHELRKVSPGSVVDTSSSVAARIMKAVERGRREIIPGLENEALVMQQKLETSRAEAASSIFG